MIRGREEPELNTAEMILSDLRRGGYVSGQEISDRLGISRSGVSKQIKSLRERGYDIDSVTNRGYRLIGEPDEMSQKRIESMLETLYIGRPTELLAEVDSTNDEIKRRARAGARQGLVVIAERQSAGRGRLGRSWTSPLGTSIYESILLRPELPPSQIPCITLAAGLAVCRTLNELYGCGAKIKWPNDVIIGRKKLCGILTEMSVEDNMVSYAVVGIGINVNNREFPPEVSEKATSLRIELGKQLERSEIAAHLSNTLEKIYDEFIMCGFEAFREEYLSLCATVGREVEATVRGKAVKGVAADVLGDGGLVVLTEGGEKICVGAGEVVVQGIY